MSLATGVCIRPATPDDVPTILQFVRELAAYERAPDAVTATAEMIHESLFGRDLGNGRRGAACEALIGLVDGSAMGFALFFHNYSTWLGRAGMYLEDLYVRPEARRRGLGKALLARVARVACERGCGRMEWSVLDWNTPAIEFYRSLGAEALGEWTVHRVSAEALSELAAGG